MKKLSKIIGQRAAVAQINSLIVSRNEAEKEGRSFQWAPIRFKGLAGSGKGYLAEAFAEAIGNPLIEAPVGAGWTWAKQMSWEICSHDDETGATTPIPATLYWDEFHCQKVLLDIVKKWTEKPVSIIQRNGAVWHFDTTEHVWIFASNERLDKAIESRCLITIPLVDYTRSEKKQIIALFLEEYASGKTIDDDAMDFAEKRTKAVARDCKAIGYTLSLIPEKRITLALCKAKLADVKRFELGMQEMEVRALEALQNGPQPVCQLRHPMKLTGATSAKEATDSLSWLASIGMVAQVSASTFQLLRDGTRYLEKLSDDIKRARAKSASVEV